MEEISDDELEARIRRNLGILAVPSTPKFTEEEKRIAERLLGRANTEVMARRVRDGERFRPAPVNIHYEYWWVEGGQTSMGWWKFVRIENGRTFDHNWHGDIDAEIARLRKKGFTVREFKPGAVASSTTRPKAGTGRKSFSERYGALPAGGRR